MPFALNQFNCIDPDSIGESGDCNSYRCPVGYECGTAQVLLWKADYSQLPTKPTNKLTITDGDGRTVTIPFLQVTGVRTVLQTDTARTDTVVQVTLADLRWSYRLVAAGASYNYRQADGTFYTASLNAGVAWTWQGVINNLWAKLVTAYTTFPSGTAPQFPTAPAGTPEGFDFDGDDVWYAINRVVQAAGYVVKYNPLQGSVTFVDPAGDEPSVPANGQSRRTYDDGVWTGNVPTYVTKARMPTVLSVVFPVPGSPNATTEDTTLSQGAVAGPKAVVWDDMPAFGATNATARTNRAAAVGKLWQSDYLTRANPNTIEFLGWAEWVTRAIALGGWSAWAVYDRGSGTPPGPGGVLTCISNRDKLRMEFDPDAGKYMPVSGSGTLTTGNVGDSGAEDSTTTVLRFDESTGVRVDKGATDADPDVVSLVFSETLNVVTNVCEILDVYGAISGIRVEYTPVTFPTGTTFGSRVCVESPDDCCPPTLECVGCPDKIVPPLTINFTATTGVATCLVASVALELVESVSIPGSFLVYAPVGYSPAGVINWTFCGGTYTTFWGFQIGCRVGTPGYDIACVTSSDNVLGGSFPDSPLGGVMAGAAGTRLNYSGGHDCDLFDTPGVLVLGTVTNPGALTSSVTVSLSW